MVFAVLVKSLCTGLLGSDGSCVLEYGIASGREDVVEHSTIVVHSGGDVIQSAILGEVEVTRHHIVEFAKLGFAEVVLGYGDIGLGGPCFERTRKPTARMASRL